MNAEVTGMNAVVGALDTNLNAAGLWAVFSSIVPLITTTTLVALGFYLVRRALKRLSKMRGGV